MLEPRGGVGSRARLALVDALLSEQDVRPCAVLALRWLARHSGVERGLCAVVENETGRLVGLTGIGLSLASVDSFAVDLNDRTHPLIGALAGSEPVAFRGQGLRQPFDTPLGTEPFYAVPLAGQGESGDLGDLGAGLLLLSGIDPTAETAEMWEENVRWAAEVLGMRLQALWYRRSRADERRHKREQSWLFGVINAVTDPILLTDGDGGILVTNASAERLLTTGEQESEGRRRAVALNNRLFSASDFTSNAGNSGGVAGGPSRHELLLVDPTEGQDLLFEVMSTPVKIRAGETGSVLTMRNVTDLRRATDEIEENYRRLRIAEAETRAERDRLDLVLNSALDPILVTDPAGNIVLMNPPAERMLTVEPGAGMGAEAERRVRTNEAVFTAFVSGLDASQPLRWRGELSLIDPPTGATVPVEAISGKVLSKQGEDTAVVTILHDLTEAVEKQRLFEQVKRHSEELREKVREATAELAEQNELLRRQAFHVEQASAAKSQFLANVSHELRTPLNAIIGYTHLLLEGVSGELNRPQREKLGRLDSNARHLLAIINDLLDVARIESGKMSVQLERVVLEELIDEVMTEVEPLIDRTTLSVTRHISPEVPELHTDRQKVKQIVLNLLSNALKFTPQGSVSIRLEYEPEREWISIAVADSGIGISEENQKTIFEAFQQADSSYARRQGGTGLGLTICRRLAAILDGQINLVSRLGEGSTFTLVLPRLARTS